MDLTGRLLGHYQIAEEISRGGMGVVYRATDRRLNRDVALKVLPDDLTHDPDRRRRFIQEAQSASQLEHPHIAVIHEVGEIEGHAYISMELIRGDKLSDVMGRQRLPVARALEIASEIAAGLARAHEKQIVHRDLKPANVMLTDEGHAKVIDFGIAKLIENAANPGEATRTSPNTDAGVVLGTMTYMSPEQARGDRVDHRSDIFSFGILLHEMLAGEPPFKGKSGIETASAIMNAPAPRLPDIGAVPEAGADIQRIVDKCLAKDPTERYQGMKDIVVDLRGARRRLESGSHAVTSATARKPFPATYALVAVAIVGIVAAAIYLTRRPADEATRITETAAKSSNKPSVAVLYFDNTTGDKDLDWLRTGITEMVVTDLSQSQDIEVVGTDRLYDVLTQLRRADDKTLSPELVAQIAERTGVDHVLVGSYMRSGDAVRINVRLQEAKTGRIVTSERAESPNSSGLFAMVDDLSRRIHSKFESIRTGIANTPGLLARPGSANEGLDRGLGDVTTSSIEAYRYYADGISLHERYRETDAAVQFEKAIKIDPIFAMAYTKLAVAQFNLGRLDLADKYAALALKNADRLTPRERFYIEGFNYGLRPGTLQRAIDAYEKCLALDAGHQACRQNLANALTSVGRVAESAAHYEELIRRGTSNPTAISNLAGNYLAMGQPEKALAVTETFAKRNPENASAHRGVGQALIAVGRYEEAIQEVAKGELLEPSDSFLPLARGVAQVLHEDWAAASETARKMSSSAEETRKFFGANTQASVDVYGGHSNAGLKSTESIAAAYKAPGARSAFGHRLVAELLVARGQYAAALPHIQRALADAKGTGEEQGSVVSAAIIHTRLNQPADAERLIADLAATSTPVTANVVTRGVRRARGEVALARGDYAAAIEHLTAAQATLSPGMGAVLGPGPHIPIWFSLGAAYFGAGKPGEAEPWFRRITESLYQHGFFPIEYVRSFYYLGRIYEAAGDKAKAAANYGKFYGYWKDGDLDRDRVAEAQRKLR